MRTLLKTLIFIGFLIVGFGIPTLVYSDDDIPVARCKKNICFFFNLNKGPIEFSCKKTGKGDVEGRDHAVIIDRFIEPEEGKFHATEEEWPPHATESFKATEDETKKDFPNVIFSENVKCWNGN